MGAPPSGAPFKLGPVASTSGSAGGNSYGPVGSGSNVHQTGAPSSGNTSPVMDLLSEGNRGDNKDSRVPQLSG